MRTALVIMLACSGAAAAPSIYRAEYPDGNARFELELHGGLPNGPGRGWHRNGKLAFEGSYLDGARHGRFRLFDEAGAFVAQAIFVNNQEVWRSTDANERPPAEWMEGLRMTGRRGLMVDDAVDDGEAGARRAPRPYFSTLDRTAGPARAGAQLGVSDAEVLDFGAAMRVDVFGHYRFGAYGAYAQVSQTRLSIPEDMTLSGRQTLVLAGTYDRALAFARLSATGGIITPLGNTGTEGFFASSAGSRQRPSDVALSIPAPFGVRSAASLTVTRGLFVVQADTGIDWMLGAAGRGFDPLAHANLGVGLGTRSTLITAEISNLMRLGSGSEHLHSIALGGTIALPILWVSASLAFSDRGTTSFLGSVGHDL